MKKTVKLIISAMVFATAVSGISAEAASYKYLDKNTYYINLDDKGKKEKITIKKKINDDKHSASLYLKINNKKINIKNVFATGIDVYTYNFYPGEKGRQLVIDFTSDSDCISDQYIIKYDKGKIKKFSLQGKEGKNKNYLNSGIFRLGSTDTGSFINKKGKICASVDTPCNLLIGCYYAEVPVSLKKDSIVYEKKKEYKLINPPNTNTYVLTKDLKLYEKPDTKSRVKATVKKDETVKGLSIIPIKTNKDATSMLGGSLYFKVKTEDNKKGWLYLPPVNPGKENWFENSYFDMSNHMWG